MAHKALCTALLVLGLFSAVSAGRSWEHNDKMQQLKEMMRRHAGEKGKSLEECQAFIGFKYEVPARLHNDFIKAWQKVEKSTFDEKGMRMYDLKRDTDSNTCFYVYGEWETMADYMDHFESDYVQEFIGFIAKEDIMYDTCLMKDVTEEKPEEMTRRHRRRGEAADTAHVMVKYTVPPSMTDKFIDAWTETAKDVWEEDGNIAYTLRKNTLNNYQFYVFAAWDSMDAYMEHLDSQHHQRLHTFFADQDITFKKTCVEKLGKMEY